MRKYLFFIVFYCFFYVGDAFAKANIVASIRPLALIAQEIAGNSAEVTTLLDKSASPHHFSLTIAQALALNEADLLLWVGPSFETFLAEGIHTKSKLSMLGESDHSHAARHPWLNSEQVSHYAERIADWLVLQNPEMEREVNTRLKGFRARLSDARQRVQSQLAPYKGRAYAVYHNAYGEFAEEFGLSDGLAITQVSHQRISAKQMARIGDEIRSAACILTERAEANQAKRYANLFEKPMEEVDLLATSDAVSRYSDFLTEIANAFMRCFSK